MTEENKPGNEERNATEKRSNTSDIYAEGNTQNTDTNHQEAKRGEPLRRYQRWQVGLAIAAAILAAIGLCILYMQTKLVSRQLGIMEKQTALTGEAMERADKRSMTSLKGSAEQSKASLEASAAQGKAALAASIRTLRLGQRPWLLVQSFKLPAEPESGKEFHVEYSMLNTGKTPAIRVIGQSSIMMASKAPPMTVFPDPTKIGSRTIIPPGPTGIVSVTDSGIVPDKVLTRYSQKKSRMYVHIRLEYTDTFGVPHWTTVCVYRIHGEPLSFPTRAGRATRWIGTSSQNTTWEQIRRINLFRKVSGKKNECFSFHRNPLNVVPRKDVAYVCVLVGPLADARGSVFSTRFRAERERVVMNFCGEFLGHDINRLLKGPAVCHSESRRSLSARGICLSAKQLRSQSRFLASLGMARMPLFQRPA